MTEKNGITEGEVVQPDALVPVPPTEWALAKTPSEVLADGHEAAKMLQAVVASKKKKVMIRGEQYLEFEDLQTLGQFYRVTAVIPENGTKRIMFGDGIHGWEAHADLINLDTGEVIGGADSMCMNDEDKWRGKPEFMLRSMAQTRACAKALRNRLSWVAVLAGYKPTPAEEMDGVEPGPAQQQPPIQQPQQVPTRGNERPSRQEALDEMPSASSGTMPLQPQQSRYITDAQRKRFYTLAKGNGKSDNVIKAYLMFHHNIDSTTKIKSEDYNTVCAWAEGREEGPPDGPPPEPTDDDPPY